MKPNELKSYRVSMGIKEVDFAEKVGIPYTTYCMKENGKRPFTDNEKIRVGKGLSMDINKFMEIFFPEMLP